MTEQRDNYQKYISQLEETKANKQILHTVYLSRRAIWANVLLSFLLSCFAAYIHTRRWKPLGFFSLFFLVLIMAIAPDTDSFEENFKRGQSFAPLMSLIATIDNSIAIQKAKKKVNNRQSN